MSLSQIMFHSKFARIWCWVLPNKGAFDIIFKRSYAIVLSSKIVCLMLKISVTTEPIDFSFHIGSRLYFSSFLPLWRQSPLVFGVQYSKYSNKFFKTNQVELFNLLFFLNFTLLYIILISKLAKSTFVDRTLNSNPGIFRDKTMDQKFGE